MIWVTVSSWSCLCWLYRASTSVAAKNIINLILVLTIWWCPCVESSLILLEEVQQYVNSDLPDVQAGIRKGRGTRVQVANICWTIKKAWAFQIIIYFCFIDYARHHQMVTTEIRLIIFSAAKDREALYSQQNQDRELTVAQIMSS